MKPTLRSPLHRILLVLCALALVALMLPHVVQAAAPSLQILSVKPDETVAIRLLNFPAGQNFTVRMDKAGNLARNGAVVGQTYSAGGGTLEQTYTIPAALHGVKTIAIRLDSSQGFFAYDWFDNVVLNPNYVGSGTLVATVAPVSSTPTAPVSASPTAAVTTPLASDGSILINVVAVKKNLQATVSGTGFPANTGFMVRVGPTTTFSTQQVIVGRFNTGVGGSLVFTLNLPGLVKDADMITVRLDGDQGQVAFNAFHNVDTPVSSAVSPTPAPTTAATAAPLPTTQPTATKLAVVPTLAPVVRATPIPYVIIYVTATPVYSGSCQLISLVPTRSQSMPTRWDFDAVWVVKNVGSTNWDNHVIDYRYLSGEKLQKFDKAFDLPGLVKPGDEVTLRADMTAPDHSGTFSTIWELHGDRGTICTLPLTITVK